MLEMKKSTTITANAYVEGSDGTKAIVATMRASIAENGTPNIVKTVMDKDLYLENKVSVDADMAEFESEVLGMVQ